jgi:predicted metal-dependent peptidase
VSTDPVPGLAGARLWAATRFPYLATGVFGATVIADAGSGGVSVDEHWRMHADPEVTAQWTSAQLGSVLVHHVCHLLRTHAERAQAAGVGPDDAPRWVRAADAEINDDLVPAGLDLPGRPVLPSDLGQPVGMLAEEYYGRDSRGRFDELMECGSGADGQPHDCDQPGKLAGWQADLLRRRVAQEIAEHGKQPGTVPAGLLRWAAGVLTPKVDWRRLLAAELRRAVSEVAGAVDYSYRKPSRRSAVSGDVVLPALRRPVPEVAVVCDTSGSMTDDLLAMVLAEVDGLLRALGLARRVRVLACDTAVAPARRVTSARQVELVGGGGTDMGAGIAAAAELRPKPAVCVVLTDGYTPWPFAAPKGMRVVVGLLGDGAPDAPRWSRSVRIALADDETIKRAGHGPDRGSPHVRLRRDGRGQLHPARQRVRQRHDRQHRAVRAGPGARLGVADRAHPDGGRRVRAGRRGRDQDRLASHRAQRRAAAPQGRRRLGAARQGGFRRGARADGRFPRGLGDRRIGAQRRR